MKAKGIHPAEIISSESIDGIVDDEAQCYILENCSSKQMKTDDDVLKCGLIMCNGMQKWMKSFVLIGLGKN